MARSGPACCRIWSLFCGKDRIQQNVVLCNLRDESGGHRATFVYFGNFFILVFPGVPVWNPCGYVSAMHAALWLESKLKSGRKIVGRWMGLHGLPQL